LHNRIRAADAILAVNSGSSSLKLTVYGRREPLRPAAAAHVERIGVPGTRLSLSSDDAMHERLIDGAGVDDVLAAALHELQARAPFVPFAVGHRIVHGGSTHASPERLTPELLADLRRLEPLDPLHMRQALAIVEAVGRRFPSARQIACFDTAFHRTMPRLAQMYPLPRPMHEAGVRRYGFHGLSCESIVSALADIAPREADGRLLIAHLGNGASVTAVRHGASVDTTMGFSPVGGLMMGTRSGDLDPGVMTYLARTPAYDAGALERIVAVEAGLLGVSGLSSDMRDLLGRLDHQHARDAVDLYCYVARKHIGALAAVMGGVDGLVFTGGIGEHAAPIRSRICAGLAHLGASLDDRANEAGRPVISRPGNAVTVRVMHTDEDLMIARHVSRLIA
jgi:acetate kinase